MNRRNFIKSAVGSLVAALGARSALASPTAGKSYRPENTWPFGDKACGVDLSARLQCASVGIDIRCGTAYCVAMRGGAMGGREWPEQINTGCCNATPEAIAAFVGDYEVGIVMVDSFPGRRSAEAVVEHFRSRGTNAFLCQYITGLPDRLCTAGRDGLDIDRTLSLDMLHCRLSVMSKTSNVAAELLRSMPEESRKKTRWHGKSVHMWYLGYTNGSYVHAANYANLGHIMPDQKLTGWLVPR